MAINDILLQYGLRYGENLNPPVMLPSIVEGAPGSTTYEYRATFSTLVGETTPCDALIVTNGPATVSPSNRVRLGVDSIPAAARSIRFFKKSGSDFLLLGSVAPPAKYLYDEGQALGTAQPPTVNTSGRPDWLFLLPNKNRRYQRSEVTDMLAMTYGAIRNVGDVLHRNGDIISGCQVQDTAEPNVKKITAGVVYVDGHYPKVPEGTVTLIGTGTEKVGLKISPVIVTYLDDQYLRNPDEGRPYPTYGSKGMDRLVLDLAWVTDGYDVLVHTFIDGQPKLAALPKMYSELEEWVAQRIYDVSGPFVTEPFQIEVLPLDADNLTVKVNRGTAYPDGYRIKTIAPQSVTIPKARTTRTINGSGVEAFDHSGGWVLGIEDETFDVDGKAIKLKVGVGNFHTVTFSGNGKTAVEVATAINSSVNAYPTAGEPVLVLAWGISGKVMVNARAGESLELATVANDAYSILGLTVGVYATAGQRIYPLEKLYVKTITDMVYSVEIVKSIVHNGITHVDDLGVESVTDILGASTALADCWDSKWNYRKGVDFVQNQNSIDYSTLGGSKPGNGQTYYVRLRHNYNGTKAVRQLVEVTDAQIVKGALDGQDQVVVTGATTIKKVIDGTAVTGLSGTVKDVVSILRINNSPGQSQSEYSGYTLLKNSAALAHAVSEVDWSRATAQPQTGNTYYCSFRFWWHSVEGDWVGPDSYDLYPQIEKSPNPTYSLRDCLDFRTVGGQWPRPDESPVFDLEYYLRRQDKIAVDRYGTFARIAGQPGDDALRPADQTGKLSIACIVVYPYTYSAKDTQLIPIDALRTTQAGIQVLARKIERQEYFSAVRSLADKATEAPAAQTSRGILTDSLTGSGRADIAFDKVDKLGNRVKFDAAIDSINQCVRLPMAQRGIELTLDEDLSNGFARVGKTMTLQFSEEVIISQERATQSENVNPDDLFSWQGVLKLNPEQDYYQDTEQLPELATNFDQNFEAFAGAINPLLAKDIVWGSWDLTGSVHQGVYWQGRTPGMTDEEWAAVVTAWQNAANSASGGAYGSLDISRYQRTGTQMSVVPGAKTVDLGDRVVDMTMQPYMRTTLDDGSPFYIECTVDGMYATSIGAGTEIAGTINGVPVALIPTGSTQAGTNLYQGLYSTVKLTDAGRATFKFQMPAGIPVGQREVKVFVWNDDPVSVAAAVFTSVGWRQTTQGTTVGYSSLAMRAETVVENKFVGSGFGLTGMVGTGSIGFECYTDPLAQTFLMTVNEYTYISGIDLFFRTKDAKLPVTVEIRTTENGYPTRTVLQTKTLYPEDVHVSEDSSLATKFTFESVVGYQAGEYAIAILTNCISYEAWICELGKIDVQSGEVVRAQAYGGVLFHSPNNYTWEPYTKKDLKFRVYKSNFVEDMQLVFNVVSGIEASMIVARIDQFIPENCLAHWFYSVDGGGRWIEFLPNLDTALGQIATSVKLRCDVTAMKGGFQVIEKFMGILILLNQPTGSYISANMVLTDEQNKITAYLDCETDGFNGAGVRTITVHYTIDNGDYWVEMEIPAGYEPVASETFPFTEYQFETPGEASITAASNATPIVITSANHKYKANALVVIAGVGGNTNANGIRRIKNVTANTFELVDPTTGAGIAGNGSYSGGGTINLAPFTQCRFRILHETDNQAVTPMSKDYRFICSEAA